MNRHIHVFPLLSLATLLAFALTACEKVELPQEKNPTETPENGEWNTGEEYETGDNTSNDIDYDDKLIPLVEYFVSHGNTPETAFIIADFHHTIPLVLEHATEGAIGFKDACVEGYIVGYVPKGGKIQKAVFQAGNVQTNIVLADSPKEKDYNNCIAVQLTTGSKEARETRAKLNLADNPQNLGRKVLLLGNVEPYLGKGLGLTSTRDYRFLDIPPI